MARDDNYVSFVITRKSGSRVALRRVSLHRNFIFALCGVALLLVGVAAFGLYGVTQGILSRQAVQENVILRDQNKQSEQQFKQLHERIKAIEEQSRRLAEMAGNANQATPQPTQPVGSPVSGNFTLRYVRFNGTGGPAWPLDFNLADTDNLSPEELEQKVALLEKKLRDYEAIIAQQVIRPSIWPVTGRLTDFFGARRNPFGGGSAEFHPGQDIANSVGTPIMATANGTVTTAGWQSGYGRLVEIEHGNGLTTRYGHLYKIDVGVGQQVTRGQIVGKLGSSGRSTGPHLHYEVRINDETVDPMSYLPREAWVEEELKKN